MAGTKPEISVAERLADAIARCDASKLPPAMRETCERLLIDIAGLCVAARGSDYVASARRAFDDPGPATVIGQPSRLSASAAAFINGTAAHGEDYDDTFEGGPVHAGAVIVPAVLAAAEQRGKDGQSVLLGLAVGVEVLCRLSTVIPKAVHASGFHPTAVFGTMGAAAGVCAMLGLDRRALVNALGVAGSMTGGIIEYLAEGAWTKRMHAGSAAAAGLKAAYLGEAGFVGPRTVFEGSHGLFNAFARDSEGNWAALLDGFGERWVTQTLAFKPYPCGTMVHPYIDCALRLRAHNITPDSIEQIVCEAAAGTLHRLWEPLAAKRRPPNGYAAKFSTPYCIARALIHGNVGLDAFSDEAVRDPRVLALAGKVGFVVDPDNPYPANYTGHVRLHLAGGRVVEERQPHLRGGAHAPLSRAEIEEKFRINCRSGGWPDGNAAATLALCKELFNAGAVDLTVLRD